mgnify:CR=1 FL=1
MGNHDSRVLLWWTISKGEISMMDKKKKKKVMKKKPMKKGY